MLQVESKQKSVQLTQLQRLREDHWQTCVHASIWSSHLLRAAICVSTQEVLHNPLHYQEVLRPSQSSVAVISSEEEICHVPKDDKEWEAILCDFLSWCDRCSIGISELDDGVPAIIRNATLPAACSKEFRDVAMLMVCKGVRIAEIR